MMCNRLFHSIRSDMDHAAKQNVRQARSRPNSIFICLTVLGLLSFGAYTHVADGQLVYDHTSFVAGFGSGPEIWQAGYADLNGVTPPSYLSGSIVLGTVGYAPVSDSLRYDQLVARLGNYLSAGGQHVLVGHSLGSLVSRGTYINNPGVRPEIAAIIAVAGPHEGAPLADNFNQARLFLGDVQRRVNDAIGATQDEASIIALFTPPGTIQLYVSIAAILFDRAINQPIDLGNIATLGSVPALPDLSPSSAAIQNLNAHTDDAVIPRANIFGTIPFANAAIRVQLSSQNNDAGFNSEVSTRNKAVTLFKVCKYVGYATIIMGRKGRTCAYGVKVLQRVDERWALYVNGADSRGNARYVPFDGIVPNERSVYPSPNGVAYNIDVFGVNHQNIYKTRAGLDKVAAAMAQIGMATVGGGGGGQPLTASISGPDAVNTDWYSTWGAQVSGGTPPYTYSWSGLFYGSGSSISGTTASGGDLILDVYDAASGHFTTTKTVSSTGCSGQYLC